MSEGTPTAPETDELEKLLSDATPGPWTVRKWAQAMTITGNVHQVVSEENYPTAFVPAWDDPRPGEIDGTDEAKANAALIAAAPTLAASLIALRAEVATLRAERDEAQTDLGKVIMSLPTGRGMRLAGAVEGVKMLRASEARMREAERALCLEGLK